MKINRSALIHKFGHFLKYINSKNNYLNERRFVTLLIVCLHLMLWDTGSVQMSAATCRSCEQLGCALSVKAWDQQRIPAGSGTVIWYRGGGAPPLDTQISCSLIGQPMADSFKSPCSGNRSTFSVSCAVLLSAAAQRALCLQNGFSTSVSCVSRSGWITARFQFFLIEIILEMYFFVLKQDCPDD